MASLKEVEALVNAKAPRATVNCTYPLGTWVGAAPAQRFNLALAGLHQAAVRSSLVGTFRETSVFWRMRTTREASLPDRRAALGLDGSPVAFADQKKSRSTL